MNEDQRKHLELIQNAITRTNSNSFQLKGLAITISTAILGIFITNSNMSFVYIGLFPTILFWFLDAYYLQIERKMRGVYDDVAGITSTITVLPYEFPLTKYKTGKYSYINSLFSKSVAPLFISMIILMLTIGLLFVNTSKTCL